MLNLWRRRVDQPDEITFLKSSSTGKSNRSQGWRFGVLMCTVSTCVVLVVNTSLATWALAQHGWGQDGQPILHEGKCDTTSKISTGLHLLINAMSTALLSSSSYCMQCLSAPTRQELNLAHKKRSWLDIGVLSPRNIRSISKSRRWRWLILGLSTAPLHLFYNSVIFASTGTNLYYPLLVKESLLRPETPIELGQYALKKWTETDAKWSNYNPNYDRIEDDARPWIPEAERLRALYTNGGLQRLENHECIKTYATQFQKKGSLFLVTKNESSTYPFISYLGGPWASQDWICKQNNCDDSDSSSDLGKDIWAHSENWNIDDTTVAYCLLETPPERCRVQFSLPLAFIVIFINAIKAICMLTMLLKLDEKMNDPPIMNLGDTVTSYLERSDAYTKDMGLTGLDDLRRATNMSHRWDTRPKEYKGTHRLRFSAASRTRWALTSFLYIGMLTVAAWLMNNGVGAANENAIPISFAIIRSLGWGKVDVRTMIYANTTDLITNAMIANSPQVVLSWVYFSYNGLLTLLALAREWESYARHRKGLRVSSVPQGKQRSTYFLQLPYRIAVPFTVLSAFLHWLVSQSFFLVSVQLYGYTSNGWTPVRKNQVTRVSLGYSIQPMVVALATGGFLLVAILGAGCLPFKTAMPVVGNCSAAIAAACQPLGEDDGEAATSAVQWGVIGQSKSGTEHCGFSRQVVEEPIVGERYR